jgi:hypothetical protein
MNATGIEAQNRFRPALMLAMALELVVVLVLVWDWNSHRPTSDQRVRTGQVVSRETAFVGPFSRPLLTIQVDGFPATIKSVLMVNSSRQLPSTVSFYFPPADPADVQLLEETSSLTIALFLIALFVFSLGLLIFIPAPARGVRKTK